MEISALGLKPELSEAVRRAHGLHLASPIQQRAIPTLLNRQDALVSAPTGSGKTLAYGLALLNRLLESTTNARKRPPIRNLVLVPTRELALQVTQTLRAIAQHLPQLRRIHAVHGGVSINPQMLALRGGSDLLVATPGRLLDLVHQNAVQLADVECLVLDEADRLLELGFASELAELGALLPTNRQTVFVSATLPPAARRLASEWLHEPLEICQDPASEIAPDITQRAFRVDTNRRTQLLRKLIEAEKWPRVLVFVATKLATEIVADKLRKAGIDAEPFHGELSQGKRNQVLADFKSSRIEVVVATDVAARGLDIAELPVVVNFDLPRSTSDYTHRIGRTGRAGASGLAISFVTADGAAHFGLIQKRHDVAIALETWIGFEPTETATPLSPSQLAEAGNGGIKGKRPSKKDKLRAAAALNQPTPST